MAKIQAKESDKVLVEFTKDELERLLQAWEQLSSLLEGYWRLQDNMNPGYEQVYLLIKKLRTAKPEWRF